MLIVLILLVKLERGYSEGLIIEKSPYLFFWNNHKSLHRLEFNITEEAHRFKIFLQNSHFVDKHNAQNKDLKLELNHLAHLEPHEVPKCFKAKKEFSPVVSKDFINNTNIPIRPYIDWRDYGMVSPIRDQGSCGSCYSFSAIGAIESHFAIRTGKMDVLSEQEIVDCSMDFGNEGCSGGYMDNVFEYAEKYGVSLEKNYPYHAKSQACKHLNSNFSHKLLGHVDIDSGNELDLVRALSFIGPVSIAMDVNHKEFMFYKSGILRIKSCSRTDLDHGILAVGYETGSNPNLIVKNSWGEGWGEKGYFRVALFENNMCGLATMASYPIPNPLNKN